MKVVGFIVGGRDEDFLLDGVEVRVGAVAWCEGNCAWAKKESCIY